ncbi:Y-family DNA polymerase [Lysobacter solisilvae (ex Woo and Kim 2020)]|uniref:DNA polymerase Y family protein n=1 Tax=Agrilutibacter terrestris TaxID=2865112 RepID=A0A7H0FXB1_9GAMM|nr:DNA polymerase Y family protein [Lysobacter terrestris]QNP40677.1 DNA polymerase Y family protein [Lysobacter terrestris]
MRWACLFLPQLAIDGVLRRHPDRDAPLVLLEGPVQRRVVHAVNPAGRALGLRPGMPLAAAQALGGRFAMADHDPTAAERWRQLLAAWAYRFSSQVSTDLAHAVVLEVGHSLQLFGPWPRLEARMREELQALGFRHRLVVAPNPHAARVLANVHDGLAVGDSSCLNALGQLPIERAGLPQDVAHALSRMGLRKLRQVFALPRDTLNRRFPRDVLQHLDRLRGAEAPLNWYQPPDVFEGRIEFEHEVESSQALLFPLRRLTADLAAFLAGRDGGVQRFSVVLEHDGMVHQPASSAIEVGLLAAERDAVMLFELARGRIEQAEVPAPVRGMQLIARELPAFVPAARDLFDPRPQQAVPWTQLRERLRARLGDDAVHSIGWLPEHRPEHVVAGTSLPRKMGGLPTPLRPGWLLPQAMPLRERVQRVLAGPERIESGWWDAAEIRRDYYLIETASGQRAWAFRIAGEQAGPFMLHGWFA